MDLRKPTPAPAQRPGHPSGANGVAIAADLLAKARADPAALLQELASRPEGLSQAEADARVKQVGPNEIAREKSKSAVLRLLDNIKDPLVLLLVALGVISFLTGDLRAMLVIFVMVVLGVVLRFYQEMRADHAAEQLKAMVSNTATVVRDGAEAEMALKLLVPGDIVHLAAGDMVPADVRLLTAKDLFLNQAALTGEALPVERKAELAAADIENPLDLPNLCFLGSNVESGSASAVVIHTGERTYFGALAASIVGQRELTSFDKGINQFTWLMIRFIAVMVPAVFLINGLTKQDWLQAFLFAVAVAVGLTPEMLPMIVTVNLSNGALAMARKKVIVKRLNAIQNFGAMDVLCTDKTGTITQGKIVLEKHLDARGEPSEKVLNYGYLNSYYHTGLKNLLDEAILDHEELQERLKAKEKYHKVDEIPFDFVRRRMSVVVEDESGLNTLICKGATSEVMSLCSRVELNGEVVAVLPEHDAKRRQMVEELNGQGFRVIALAYKEMPGALDEPVYSVKDEADLILLGFLAFLDPPKETAAQALQQLHGLQVDVKILTGDNEIITAYICGKVGLPVDQILLGAQVETLSEAALAAAASTTSIFARLAPAHKERIIKALQSTGHVVGFMGDGINDAPALKAADVGISVDSAVDIAKESSDIILLENNLLILQQGRAGRPARLRQHRQVHQDGRQLQLRQHVQRRGGQRLPALPAHAADPGAHQQSALRLLADDHSHRQGGRRLADQAAQMDDRRNPTLYSVYRPYQFNLRLPDIFHHAAGVRRLEQPGPVPHRLVRGVDLHANADHPCDTHAQDSIHPKPGQLAADRLVPDHRCRGRLAAGFAPGRHAWVCAAAAAVLAAAGDHADRLRDLDPIGKNLVLPSVW